MKFLVRFLIVANILLASLLIRHFAEGKTWPTNYQHFNAIRTLAQGLHRGDNICFTLDSGELVFGTFLKYEPYTDYIWYQPQNTQSVFSQDAFEVHEVFNLQLVEPI